MPAETILYKGELGSEGEGIEYFDITTEMQTGCSISHYAIPDEYLEQANEEQTKKALDFLGRE
jgi:hypothetical protein